MPEQKSNKKDTRSRNWSFIVYPESAPENWREIIDAAHVAWAESPMHDKDVDPDGEVKKPHWHVIVCYEGKKSFEQAKSLSDSVNAPKPEGVASARGMIRYFLHLDNPEKHQYAKEELICHGGFDVVNYLKATTSSRYELIKEMRGYITENGITEFCDIFDYAAEERYDDWFPLLCDNSAYVIGQHIKSLRHKKEKQEAMEREARRPSHHCHGD
jgi:hypothetical protein